MSKGYLAVGHGRENNGVWDPGAVTDGGQIREHDLALTVVTHMNALMENHGLEFVTESAGGASHDPDYVGSSATVNVGKFDWAIEVHFDYDRAPRGGFGLYVSDVGRQWADFIHQEYVSRGMPTRPDTKRTDLYFLNVTRCPAVIWECDRVGRDVTADDMTRYGEALAVGTLRWLEARGLWVPSGGATPSLPVTPQPPAPAPQQPTGPVGGNTRPDSRPARAYPGHLLKIGSSDPANVRALQQRLHDLGYGIVVDGGFGPQTDGIVRDFQRDQSIAVDGVVGPGTWGRLFK